MIYVVYVALGGTAVVAALWVTLIAMDARRERQAARGACLKLPGEEVDCQVYDLEEWKDRRETPAG